MEVDSDSSSGSVIITGPIPEYPELRKRTGRMPVAARKKRNDSVVMDIITQDEKVEKIQELEDLVRASATLPRSCDIKEDEIDGWSGSDTKSIKGSGKRDPAAKYLKKIKTLQQNKRRQETRISRLTKEVRSLRDKVSVQAAYIDVLCGMLGDDMKEKFRDRQGMGILGNTKLEEDNLEGGAGVERGDTGTWAHDDAGNDKTSCCDGAMKEKERDFYCVEDLDEVAENGVSHDGSSDDMKAATKVKDSEDDVLARPLDNVRPSTSFGGLGKKIKSREVRPDEMSALTIAVGKQHPTQMMCNAFLDNQIGVHNGQDEIHHEVFGPPYERRLCAYEGQVGESMFADKCKEDAKETNFYNDMRVQASYNKPHRELMPPVITYGMVMGNHGLNLLPAVHPTTDDPLNIGSDDASSFGPLIITTSLDPLNLIKNPSTADRMKCGKSNPSLHDPLNIESDDTLIDDPRDLPEEADPIGPNQSTALLISMPGCTQAPQSDQSKATDQAMETESIDQPPPNTDESTLIHGDMQDGDTEHPITTPSDSNGLFTCSSPQNKRPERSMPQISDIADQHERHGDDSGNISHPQEIVDHLINNISCDLSPDLRLE